MSSTPSCEVCTAPAVARVGGVPFCARCAVSVDPTGPLPRRSAVRRRARPIVALGLVAGLLGAGLAVAALRANQPAVVGAVAADSPRPFAAAETKQDPSPQLSELGAAAQDYASAVGTWADCVSAGSSGTLDAARILERCASLRPEPLDASDFGLPGIPPVLAMGSRATPMGHVLEGLDDAPRQAVSTPDTVEAVPPSEDSAPPPTGADPQIDDGVDPKVPEPPDEPESSHGDDGIDPATPPSDPDRGGDDDGDDSPPPADDDDGGDDDDDDDDDDEDAAD